MVTNIDSWSTVFGRSRVVPAMYPVHRSHADAVLDLLDGIGVESWGTGPRMFDSSCSAYPLLDGAVCGLATYGLAPMPSGVRVLGSRPLRLLCALMNLRAPVRLLAGEKEIPTNEQLLADLARQLSQEQGSMKEQARKAMFQDTDSATAAVVGLFGTGILHG